MKQTGIFISVSVGLALLVIGGFAFRWFTAPARGKLEMREEVQSGTHRKQSYEHFYDLCVSIQRKKTSLQAQQDLVESSTGKQKQRAQTRVAALKAQLQSSVSKYNMDARKVKTKAKFLGEDLPVRISAEEEVICRRR